MRSSILLAAVVSLSLFACASSSEENAAESGAAISAQSCSSDGLKQTYAKELAALKASYDSAMSSYENAVAEAQKDNMDANADAIAAYNASIDRAKSLLDKKLFIAGVDIGDGETEDQRTAAINQVVNDHIVETGANGPIASQYKSDANAATAAYLAAAERAGATYKTATEAAASTYASHVRAAYDACR